MKRKRHSDEQITFAPRRTESGTSEEEVCRWLRGIGAEGGAVPQH